jgi:hypothetical protein
MINRIISILLIILGTLMILGGAFALCWPSLAFLTPFFSTCIALGVVMVFVISLIAAFNWSDWDY